MQFHCIAWPSKGESSAYYYRAFEPEYVDEVQVKGNDHSGWIVQQRVDGAWVDVEGTHTQSKQVACAMAADLYKNLYQS